MPPSFPANKQIRHHNTKSTPALSVMAQGARNTARRAFGDVSNTKDLARASRDDCATVGKPAAQQAQKAQKVVLSQPAQRPMSMSGLKGVLNTVTAKPTNPAGKAQPAAKNTKRNNVVFRDQLETVDETESSKETIIKQKATEEGRRGSTQSTEEKKTDIETVGSVARDHKEPEAGFTEEEALRLKEYLDRRASSTYSDATISDTEESKEDAKDELKKPAVATSEPEAEEWEDAEEDNHAAPSFLSRTDNTTGGTTTVIFPKVTAVTKREMLRAKDMVESSRSEEDLLEDFYDSSMVAEYSSEIFLHLRNKEVCYLSVSTTISAILTHLDCHAAGSRLHDQPGRDPMVHAICADGLAGPGAFPLCFAPGDTVSLRQLH